MPLTEAERASLSTPAAPAATTRGHSISQPERRWWPRPPGAKVAKHGNRAVTSTLRVGRRARGARRRRSAAGQGGRGCLRATGFTFLHAPSLNPSLKRVQPVRKSLGFRTIFNLAGPLSNPGRCPDADHGSLRRQRLAVVARSMAKLGVRHAFVVHGLDGLDELTVTGESRVAEVTGTADRATGNSVRLFRLTPEAGWVAMCLIGGVGGRDGRRKCGHAGAIFAGENGPKRDVVLLNAAGALWLRGHRCGLPRGHGRAARRRSIRAAMKTLSRSADLQNSLHDTPSKFVQRPPFLRRTKTEPIKRFGLPKVLESDEHQERSRNQQRGEVQESSHSRRLC